MSDPLDDLKRAHDRVTPAPDPHRRKTNLARALARFDELQETAAPLRRTDNRPNSWLALLEGVRQMPKDLLARPALAAAACLLVAVGLGGFFVYLSREQPAPDYLVATVEEDAGQPGPTPLAEPVAEAEPLREAEPTVVRESPAEPPTPRQPESPPAPQPEPAPPVEGAAELRRGDLSTAVRVVRDPGAPVAEPQPELPPPDDFGVAPGATVPLERRRAELGSEARIEAESSLRENIVFQESALAARSLARSVSVADPVPAPPPPLGETFANESSSPVKLVADEPVSTFSIDVDTASYSFLRSSLMEFGDLPPAGAVRIEELINYFPYGYPAPTAGEAPFRSTVTVMDSPWNVDTLLIHIGIQGRRPAVDDRPPLNLVFLVDVSGSMNSPKKLPLLRQSFRMMLGQLRPTDEVAIVTYASGTERVLAPTPASDRMAILAALDRLDAAGSTAGSAGIQLAYRTAEEMTAKGEVTRVLLATDGDFNVGIADPAELESFIARWRDSGIYLSVLGFGRGNLQDATMQALAQNGNGQAAYIDTLAEAQKVLVDQLVGTLFPIADDVKIQVEFNPRTVAEYRLIGYETRSLRRQDFNNDRVDAGEIGAGHAVTAIYEVAPVGSPAVLHDALRYAESAAERPNAPAGADETSELAFLRLRYKAPGESSSRLIELPIVRGMGAAGEDQRFAAAVAGFGQLLRAGAYIGDWTYADAIALAERNTGADPFGYRREAVTLMRLAESLSP